MNKKLFSFVSILSLLGIAATSLSACNSTREVKFTYSETPYEDILGSKMNDEAHNYDALKVNPTDTPLREDFAYGVDASMVYEVEKNGGVYYNQAGQEQDVFQILNQNGANFLRLRLWNQPSDRYGREYGGGNNTVEVDIELAKRAQAANMNIMIDFHYSDFWADPDKQWIPKDWGSARKEEVPNLLYEFTRDTLQQFKDAGVNVNAVQVGNEINNGLVDQYGKINWSDSSSSFDYIAELLSAGIKASNEIFPDAYTMIHLANGGNADEFETFFTNLDARGVNYDIIGASFYPYLSGTIENLEKCLNNIVEITNKPVIIAETSWGFTTDYNEYTANQFDESDAETGGYLISEQAQATMIRDLINLLANIPNQMGLGIFYWEPAWLPVEGASWATASGQSYAYHGDDLHRNNYEDGLNSWANQGLFSYSGKALSSIQTYKLIKEGGQNVSEETSLRADYDASNPKTVTINLAANETLPSTYPVITDFDAYRDREVIWSEESISAVANKGTYTVEGVVDGQFEITMIAYCIENYVVDPGFENQGESDSLVSPWNIRSSTPSGEKVVKLDRKSDTRSGTTDLNWYYASTNFTFDVYQTINNMPAGTYDLRTYVLTPTQSQFKHDYLIIYIAINGVTTECDMTDKLAGWSAGYQEASILNIDIPANATVEIGIKGSAVAGAWGHNDDWELVQAE